MNNIEITPNKIKGGVTIPPSKSMAHRAIICASLSKGKCKIDNIDLSDDIIATINAMKSLGADIKVNNRTVIVEGIFKNNNIKDDIIIDCNESGSTLRFLIPVSMIFNNNKKFIGRGNLGKRPLDVFYEIFNKQNIKYTKEEENLNLKINGTLKPDTFYVKGDISSQFITGLLFTLPLLNGDSVIKITSNLESKSYLDLTLDILKTFGIEIINKDYKEFIIKGNQEYLVKDYIVEGDYSQAAFFISANYIGNNVDVKGLKKESLQGDKEIIKWIDVLKNNDKKIIDATNCPDIIPVLTVCAALTKGKTKIINAGRLRIKECDRLHAISSQINKLGGKVIEGSDYLEIYGIEEFNGGFVDSFNDHRIAMSLAILSTRAKDKIVIKNYKCINKSYPTFFEDFKALGGKINECDIWQ